MLKITNEDIKQIDLKNFSSELIKRTPSEEYDDSDLDEIENEQAIMKMEEFIIHPLVYPTVESIIRDIHFKTFKKFEGIVFLDQKYNIIDSTDKINSYHSYAFLLESSSVKSCMRSYLDSRTPASDTNSEDDTERYNLKSKIVAEYVKKIYDKILAK